MAWTEKIQRSIKIVYQLLQSAQKDAWRETSERGVNSATNAKLKTSNLPSRALIYRPDRAHLIRTLTPRRILGRPLHGLVVVGDHYWLGCQAECPTSLLAGCHDVRLNRIHRQDNVPHFPMPTATSQSLHPVAVQTVHQLANARIDDFGRA